MKEIPSRYDPKLTETRIYQAWNDAGLFQPAPDAPNPPFVVVIPPPNVTGILHMGHALNTTLQDILVRYKRMRGFKTLWVPGIDHAGIATQARVEREIWQSEKKTRREIGRDVLLERIWAWKEKHGNRILEQLKKLGSSCDWTRTAFTMDEKFSRGVIKVFVEMYKLGLVYKGRRLANLSCRLETAISNDEIEHKTVKGHFYHIKYPVAGEPGRFVEIATTRPETMLGDTAVAVHPDDPRYKDLIGKRVILPIIGRELPVIADEYVDREKGTGCLKVTPAHDPNDYALGKRHNLEFINILNINGTLNENAGPYAGIDRLKARPQVVERLKEDGLLVKIVDHEHEVAHCSRSDDVIEPYLCDQWYVKMDSFVELARKAGQEGRVKFTPERYMATYFHWLDSTPDWPISRQLWWGHRIPIWTRQTADGSETYCGETAPDGNGWIQDDDVLDTWFSSQIWPMGVFGWPEPTDDLKTFYPTTVLVTGRDIIALWVARMVMMGEHFMGKAPFSDVYINGTLLDHLGRRMSKSLGNGIDPIVMIEGGKQEYCNQQFETDGFGADGVRFVLATMTTEGQDLKIHPKRFEDGRNFINKIWNVGRFVLTNLDGKLIADRVDPAALPFEFRVILSKLNRVIQIAHDLDRFRFNDVAVAVRDFAWNEFCAWTVEGAKFYLKDDENNESSESSLAIRRVLAHVMDRMLRLLHPLCPFVTEELWQLLKEIAPSRTLDGSTETDACGNPEQWIMTARFPDADESLIDDTLEADMEIVRAAISGVRAIRSSLALPPKQVLDAHLSASSDRVRSLLDRERKLICDFAVCSIKELGVGIAKPAQAAGNVTPDVSVFIPLGGLIDMDAELKRHQKELDKVEKGIDGLEKKLGSPGFASNAPSDVVESEKARLESLKLKAAEIKAHIAGLG